MRSPNYAKHALLEHALREEIIANGDSAKADTIRDEMDITYPQLTQEERNTLIKYQTAWVEAEYAVLREAIKFSPNERHWPGFGNMGTSLLIKAIQNFADVRNQHMGINDETFP